MKTMRYTAKNLNDSIQSLRNVLIIYEMSLLSSTMEMSEYQEIGGYFWGVGSFYMHSRTLSFLHEKKISDFFHRFIGLMGEEKSLLRQWIAQYNRLTLEGRELSFADFIIKKFLGNLKASCKGYEPISWIAEIHG